MYTLLRVHRPVLKMKYSKFIQHDRSNIRYSFIRYIQDHKSLCYAFAKKHQSIFSHQHVQSRAFDLLDQTSEKRTCCVIVSVRQNSKQIHVQPPLAFQLLQNMYVIDFVTTGESKQSEYEQDSRHRICFTFLDYHQEGISTA